MIKLNMIHDDTLQGNGCYLEAPKDLVEQNLNGAICTDTRISEDEQTIYLSGKDVEELLDALTRRNCRFELEEQLIKGPSFVRALSQACWV
tara:strand:+ start:480 stop:752 length:273 start_codon:yes stop_codon:yes gene_type:complete